MPFYFSLTNDKKTVIKVNLTTNRSPCSVRHKSNWTKPNTRMTNSLASHCTVCANWPVLHWCTPHSSDLGVYLAYAIQFVCTTMSLQSKIDHDNGCVYVDEMFIPDDPIRFYSAPSHTLCWCVAIWLKQQYPVNDILVCATLSGSSIWVY